MNSVLFFCIFCIDFYFGDILCKGDNVADSVADYKYMKISKKLEKNVDFFNNIFKNDAILRTKKIRVRGVQEYDCAVFYFDGMVNSQLLNDSVVKPLLTVKTERFEDSLSGFILSQVLFASEVKQSSSVEELLQSVLYGDTVLFIDGSADALIINTKGWERRSITEPQDERVLQGPREGFEETAMNNLAMIRRKLLTPDLCIEMMRTGRRSDTKVFICYLGSVVNKKILNELKKRIEKIDIDGILDSNYIAEQIRDNPGSFFRTTGSTERPDIVAARMLEGRIAVVVDGSPVAMTVPYLFSENFQSDEDYYVNYTVASVSRALRYICFFISISIPAVFVGAVTFNKGLLPTPLALSVSKLRSGVPFPVVVECFILLGVFEILQESGVRMPQSLGHALSIVGGLVVGQAAVEARVISAPVLIVVALSGISGMMIPRLKGAVFYLKFILVFLSAFFGLYGFTAGIFAAIIYTLDIKSFGINYTCSLKKANFQSLKDTVFRAPWKDMIERPLFSRDSVRMKKVK